MPKNAHPPRSGGGSKKPPASGFNGEDTSFIVFTNAKAEPKGVKKPTETPQVGQDTKGKGKGKDTRGPTADEAPKKPDTRTLIGGSSWTGKLPVNMLSEHCQKQKWGKPEYTMFKTADGFTSAVILKATNPKTREMTVLPPFKLPPSRQTLAVQPTAVEARHFAATYALFRVCSMRNIHMMMPPTYRDLWKGEFQQFKKEDVTEGKGWMYEADPFATYRERTAAKAAMAKEREGSENRKVQEQDPSGAPSRRPNGPSGGGNNRMKGWSKVPKVDMGKRSRAEVERLVRRSAVWNPHAVQISLNERATIVDEVTRLGFRRSHVEEAAGICKDQEEILEWLLIHVPEDDLPPWSLPEGYVAGISMASSDLKREAAVKRLAAAGYATDLCEEVLDAHSGDEFKAAEALQSRLTENHLQDSNVSDVLSGMDPQTDNPVDVWEEEQVTLASIYAERYESSAENTCQIHLEVAEHLSTSISLRVRRPLGPYPGVLPIIALHAPLPAYIRLSITKRALMHAKSNFLGEQMVFNLVDWLEHGIPAIIENPGRLTNVSSAICTSGNNLQETHIRRPCARSHLPKPINWRPGTEGSLRILSDWQMKQDSPVQERMLSTRRSLPAWRLQEGIVHVVNEHQVVIISGETGSGKSTQTVQFILDDLIKRQLGEAANIVCTQPRRISALGLADRVAHERCSKVGEEVGYSIRGDSKHKPGVTKISFVTTGVLLRRLQTSGGRTEDAIGALEDVSHVVVDEVHERSLDTDFLLILLRNLLKQRKDLKVILMSATLDADVFEAYFRIIGPIGRIEISGRTYPVEDFYIDDVVRMTEFDGSGIDDDMGEEAAAKSLGGTLRDIGTKINYNLVAHTVRYIDTELGDQAGGILIFLPGTLEIEKTLQALSYIRNIHALPLHASLLPSEQRRVFLPPPGGKRKVIASTNVAETSITIEDIVAVIDTGRVKETSFDPQNNMIRLEEVWASRAACKQRRGRAGRVRAGKCFKLYTRNAEISKVLERPEPEIRRVPLEQLCLSVRAMGIQDVSGFLSGALTPPDSVAVEGAVDLLRRMGALDGDELTALGRHLSMIPADLRCSKLLVYGSTFGCLDACLTIAAILSTRSPFFSSQTKREGSKAARSAFGRGQGDLLADLRAYEEWSGKKYVHRRDLQAWCEQNFLSRQTLNDITSNRSQYLSSLKEIGFIPVDYDSIDASTRVSYNRNNDNDALLRSLVAGSFNPQIARIEFPEKKFAASVSGAVELDPEARTIKYFNQDNGRVFVHPSSTMFDAQGFQNSAAFMSYFTKVATSKVFIRDLTPLNAYTLLLFSGPVSLDTLGRGLIVDGWLRLRGWARIGVLVSRLRMMLDNVLAKKIDDPSIDLEKDEIIGIVQRLVELDGMDR